MTNFILAYFWHLLWCVLPNFPLAINYLIIKLMGQINKPLVLLRWMKQRKNKHFDVFSCILNILANSALSSKGDKSKTMKLNVKQPYGIELAK